MLVALLLLSGVLPAARAGLVRETLCIVLIVVAVLLLVGSLTFLVRSGLALVLDALLVAASLTAAFLVAQTAALRATLLIAAAVLLLAALLAPLLVDLLVAVLLSPATALALLSILAARAALLSRASLGAPFLTGPLMLTTQLLAALMLAALVLTAKLRAALTASLVAPLSVLASLPSLLVTLLMGMLARLLTPLLSLGLTTLLLSASTALPALLASPLLASLPALLATRQELARVGLARELLGQFAFLLAELLWVSFVLSSLISAAALLARPAGFLSARLLARREIALLTGWRPLGLLLGRLPLMTASAPAPGLVGSLMATHLLAARLLATHLLAAWWLLAARKVALLGPLLVALLGAPTALPAPSLLIGVLGPLAPLPAGLLLGRLAARLPGELALLLVLAVGGLVATASSLLASIALTVPRLVLFVLVVTLSVLIAWTHG